MWFLVYAGTNKLSSKNNSILTRDTAVHIGKGTFEMVSGEGDVSRGGNIKAIKLD